MLFSCPTCGSALRPGSLRPRAGTAVCAEHGEVRPHVGHPAVSDAQVVDRSRDWASRWSLDGESYRFELAPLAPLRAWCAPLPWQGDVATGEWVGLLLAAPLYALTYIPVLVPARIAIGPRRVRVGPRWLGIGDGGEFAVVETGRQSSELTLVRDVDVPVLVCSRPAASIFPLRDVLNEALFIVQRQSPLPPAASIYRG